MNNNNLDDSQKQFIGPAGMPEEPEVDEILSKQDSIKFVEYELPQSLIDKGFQANVYPKLTDEAKQALDRHYRQKYLKVALECVGKDEWEGDYRMERYTLKPGQTAVDVPRLHYKTKAEIRAALKEAFNG